MKLKLYLILGILMSLTLLAIAHSGRTDSRGGHYNRKTGGYHSHGGGRSTRSYTPSSTPTAIKPAPTAIKPAIRKKTYWQSSGSGIYHNSACKYYGKTKGYYTNSDFGIKCNICKGNNTSSNDKSAVKKIRKRTTKDITRIYSKVPGVVRVRKVIDGYTIRVRLQTGVIETVRLIGVIIPRIIDDKKQVKYFKEKTSLYTTKELASQDVTLRYDQIQRGADGKLRAYLYLADGTLFNEKMIANGYARTDTKHPFKEKFMTKFQAIERQAKKNKKGLWANVP